VLVALVYLDRLFPVLLYRYRLCSLLKVKNNGQNILMEGRTDLFQSVVAVGTVSPLQRHFVIHGAVLNAHRCPSNRVIFSGPSNGQCVLDVDLARYDNGARFGEVI
jgi:hypothetical protein